jgi:hypothetical protein
MNRFPSETISVSDMGKSPSSGDGAVCAQPMGKRKARENK